MPPSFERAAWGHAHPLLLTTSNASIAPHGEQSLEKFYLIYFSELVIFSSQFQLSTWIEA